MAQNRSRSLLENLDFAVTARRNERSIITQITELEPGEEKTISLTSEQPEGKTYRIKIARV